MRPAFEVPTRIERLPRADSSCSPAWRSSGSKSGFTLIEMIIVIGLLGLVVGMGLGMFAGINPGQRAAVGLVQNVLRAAHNSAVQRAAPARVRFDKENSVMVAEAMRVIGTWHFEVEHPIRGAFDLNGVALDGGELVEDGFTGMGLSFVNGSAGAKIEIAVQNDTAYDFSRGFAIEFALKVNKSVQTTILTVGDAVRVEISRGGALGAYFVPARVDELGDMRPMGKVPVRSGPGVIQVGYWTRIRLLYNLRRFRILVDGVEVASEPAEDEVWAIDGPLIIGGGSTPLPGVIDNLVISAVDGSEEVKLPGGVIFAPDAISEVIFAAGGVLDAEVHKGAVQVEIEFADGTRQAVRVHPYGTVE